MSPKVLISTGAFLMVLAIITGAFGAHALKNSLAPERLQTWQTAVQYHAIHALGLLLIGLISAQFQINLNVSAALIIAGILIFSGSLYALCLTELKWLGAVTPIGGLTFIAGWLVLGFKILRFS